MRNIVKTFFCSTLILASLTSCAVNGGSFDVDNSDNGSIIQNPTDKKEVEYEVINNPQNPNDQSIMGFSAVAPIPKRSTFEDTQKMFIVDKHHYYYDENKNSITINDQPISIEITANEKWAYIVSDSNRFESGKAVFYYNSAFDKVLKLYSFDNILLGLVRIKDPNLTPTIFYKGINKTQEMPVEGTIIYEGVWEIATKLKGNDTRNPDGGTGDLTEDKKIRLEANFGTKQVNGEFSTNQDNIKIEYQLNAQIEGNTFVGTANGSYDFKDDNGTGEGMATVSGAFFGDRAKEVAGHIVGAGNIFAAVFSAKQQQVNNIKTDGIQFQSTVASIYEDGAITSFKSANFSGYINKLQVDGTIIDLTSDDNKVCCSQNEYVKYGIYANNESQSNQTGYFVQGITTKISELPQSGITSYQGKWYGRGQSNSSALFSKHEMDATFQADWGNKTITGKLFNDNQATDGDAAIHIEAKIEQNTFKGTANIDRLMIDTSRDSQLMDMIQGAAIVSGHFYGVQANELGGYLQKEDNSFGAVFGAKKIKE